MLYRYQGDVANTPPYESARYATAGANEAYCAVSWLNGIDSSMTALTPPVPLTPPFRRISKPERRRSQFDVLATGPAARSRYTGAPETSMVLVVTGPNAAPVDG